MSNEIRYLAEELSKQSIEGVAWLVLTSYGKMQKKRNVDKDTGVALGFPLEQGLEEASASLFFPQQGRRTENQKPPVSNLSS